jgi:hypothetical protein
MSDISAAIDKKIGEVRAEALDLSFGEIVNLHSDEELIIQPEYQRLFRWSNEQRSRLIESIILELPIPQVFVIENEDGVLELIDGLQRVSSVIQFIDSKKLGIEPLLLEGCDIIKELNGCKFEDLPLSLRLRIKRSSVRTIVIKRQSKSFLRYEMFKRLNTGGANLSFQEIRNCSARMLGDDGIKFYTFLQEKASTEFFKLCTETISQSDLDKKGDEELVLRFFAVKNAQDLFKGNIRDWLDAYMEAVLLKSVEFKYDEESKIFDRLFEYFATVLGNGSFVKYRGETPVGALAPAYFEAITMGTLRILYKVQQVDKDDVKNTIISVVQSDDFRSFTGPGANSREKLEGRIQIVKSNLEALIK